MSTDVETDDHRRKTDKSSQKERSAVDTGKEKKDGPSEGAAFDQKTLSNSEACFIF